MESLAPAVNPDLQDVVSRMLHANDSNPGFMYEDTSAKYENAAPTPSPVPEPPVQYAPPVQETPAPRYERYETPRQDSSDLLNALQYERARNEQLSRSVEVLKSYESAFEADPALAQGLINYFTTGSSSVGGGTEPANSIAPSETRAPQAAVVPPILKKQIENLEGQIYYMRLENEAAELERRYPGTFQRGPVAMHMTRTGKTSLTEAFNDLLGSAVGELIRGQQMQQQHQQQQAWMAYQQQYRQQMQQYQQQMAQQQYQQPQETQQVAAPSTVTNVNPPPSYDAVVSRPGAGLPTIDPFENVKAKSWKEAEALMLHDMKSAGFAI